MPRKITGSFKKVMVFDEQDRLQSQKIDLPPPRQLPCIVEITLHNSNRGLDKAFLYLGKLEKVENISKSERRMTIVEVDGSQTVEFPLSFLLSCRIMHDKDTTQKYFKVKRGSNGLRYLTSKKIKNLN